jgi:endoglucanase
LVPKIQGDGNLVSQSRVINIGVLRAVKKQRYRTRVKLIHRLALFFLFALTASAQNDLPAMKRITGTNTPAHIAARGFMRGANIANFLEVSPGGGSVRHTVTDLQQIRAEGFDHVRLPVAWHHYTGPGPEFKLPDRIFAKVDYMVTNATALGLNVIIDFHNFDEFIADPGSNTLWFEAIWRQVAAHYADAPSGVVFELLNEPHDTATTVLLNPIYAETIRLIRQTNPHRTLFVGPGRWNSAEELLNLRLPDDDDNLIVTVHCYDPFHFTHQGATWAGPDVLHVIGVVFPGPPAAPLKPDPSLSLNPWVLEWIDKYNTYAAETNPCSPIAFVPKIQHARAWSEEFGRPVHLGEFGAYTKADQASRARFYGAFRQALDAAGIGWAIWDWKSGFNYWDTKAHRPLPGMREALFPTKAQKAGP